MDRERIQGGLYHRIGVTFPIMQLVGFRVVVVVDLSLSPSPPLFLSFFPHTHTHTHFPLCLSLSTKQTKQTNNYCNNYNNDDDNYYFYYSGVSANSGAIPLFTADASGLTGVVLENRDPSKPGSQSAAAAALGSSIRSEVPPSVLISRTQAAFGRPQVFAVQSSAHHVEQVVDITLDRPLYKADGSPFESFFVDVSSPRPAPVLSTGLGAYVGSETTTRQVCM